jgi:hypothetical protein
LIAFQHRFQLEETGEIDDATRQKLEQIHDRVSDFPPPPKPPAQSDGQSDQIGEDS